MGKTVENDRQEASEEANATGKKPFFSIIIPVYNVAPYLRECLDSVLAQTFGDWEAICVDDGSTDGSGAILDEYAAKDKRIREIHQPNAGVSAARNAALDLARGQYIGFIDGDDVIMPMWLAHAHRILEAGHFDILRMQFMPWAGLKISQDLSCQEDSIRVYKAIGDLQDAYASSILMGGWVFLLFIAKQLISTSHARFPVGMRMREDVIFGLSLVRFLTSMCQCDYAGYLYRQINTSATNVRACNQDCVRYITELKGVIRGLKISEGVRSAISYSVASSVYHWYNSRETGDAWKIARSAVIKCCRKAYNEKLIRMKGLPLGFKVQQCGIVFFNTFMGFEVVRIAKGISRRLSWLPPK